MADKKSEGESEETPKPKKGGGLKFIIVVLALLGIEGGVLFFVFSSGKSRRPSPSSWRTPRTRSSSSCLSSTTAS
jgi:flagellar basal body-associated protein FliL